jgi:hypothetical protein
MVDEKLGDEWRRAPIGHRVAERPLDDKPYVKRDGPGRRLFSDSELAPRASMLRHSWPTRSSTVTSTRRYERSPSTGSAWRAYTCRS